MKIKDLEQKKCAGFDCNGGWHLCIPPVTNLDEDGEDFFISDDLLLSIGSEVVMGVYKEGGWGVLVEDDYRELGECEKVRAWRLVPKAYQS